MDWMWLFLNCFINNSPSVRWMRLGRRSSHPLAVVNLGAYGRMHTGSGGRVLSVSRRAVSIMLVGIRWHPSVLSSWEDAMIELLFPASASFKRIRECSSEAERVNGLQSVAGRKQPARTNNGSVLGKSRRVGTLLFFHFVKIIRVKPTPRGDMFLLHAPLSLSKWRKVAN